MLQVTAKVLKSNKANNDTRLARRRSQKYKIEIVGLRKQLQNIFNISELRYEGHSSKLIQVDCDKICLNPLRKTR